MQGDVPIQYAALKRDLRAPTVKSMVLQTQNDGQRKMMPVVKANPWGLQLKNRINFSENNILEADLKGNVVSKDAIGGQILKTPNVFKNEATFNYAPSRNPAPLSGAMSREPSSRGFSSQMDQTEQLRRQTAEELARRQGMEANQPSFFQKLSTGMPLRPQRNQPNPISQSIPQRRPSIFDRVKRVVGGASRAEEEAQAQSFADEQQYIDQTQIQQALEPAGTAQPDQEVEINMSEEEFNRLSVADQEKIIQSSQQQQMVLEQMQLSEEQMMDVQAQQAEDIARQKELAAEQRYLVRSEGRDETAYPGSGVARNQASKSFQTVPGARGGQYN